MAASKSYLEKRIAFKEAALEKLYNAYLALVDGGVKSYRIDDRDLTKFDIDTLREEISTLEKELDELNNLLGGVKPRKAFGIIPRDW